MQRKMGYGVGGWGCRGAGVVKRWLRVHARACKLERRRVGIYCMTPVYRGYTHARTLHELSSRTHTTKTHARTPLQYLSPFPLPPSCPFNSPPYPSLSLTPPPPRSSSVRASPPLTAPGVDFPATYSPSLLRVFILGDKLVKSLVCVRVV